MAGRPRGLFGLRFERRNFARNRSFSSSAWGERGVESPYTIATDPSQLLVAVPRIPTSELEQLSSTTRRSRMIYFGEDKNSPPNTHCSERDCILPFPRVFFFYDRFGTKEVTVSVTQLDAAHVFAVPGAQSDDKLKLERS